MLQGLDGRRALLTGASGGIGAAIARALHAQGMHLFLSGRKVGALEALAAELGERAEVLPADLADRAAVEIVAERAAEVDVLVANAALPASGRLDDFSPEELDRALDVNLRAPMHLARAAAAAMVRRGQGQLVFISSISGKLTTPRQSVYSGTKFGLRGFALALRQDLHGTGVGVTTVFPGFVSGSGMFVDSGVPAPRGVGTSSPEQVAAAVVAGIRSDRAEIGVAPIGVRASAVVAGFAPSLVAGLMRRLGSARIADAVAAGQRDKR